jgi:hypothetical protein
MEFIDFYDLVRSRICEFDMVKLKHYISSQAKVVDHESLKNSELIDEEQKNNRIKAATYCLNKLREIQYKLPTEKLSNVERDLLWSNRKYLNGHSKWDIQLIKLGINTSKILDDSPSAGGTCILAATSNRLSCWETMCTRHCFEKIQLSEIIDVIVTNNQLELDSIISDCISMSDTKEIMLFLPVLSVYLSDKICNMLIKEQSTSNEFLSEFYWCIKEYRTSGHPLRLLEAIEKHCPAISKMKKLLEILQNKTVTAGKLSDLISPINPSESVSLDIRKVTTIKSASKPLMVPLENDTGIVKHVLFKSEDIRKDHIVSNLISFACLKLQNAGIPVDTITYKVTPMTDSSGLIEIVENSTTIHNITQNMGFTVQNYINEYNPDAATNKIIDRFMRSTSIYCIISYLLGFGDRHLDNIMISKSGLLFHVDFSYILGKDPKYNNSKHIRLTPEIINVIGGYNSRKYLTFKKYCIEVYNELRLHINAFMNMLLVLSEIDPTLTKEYIQKELLSRFEVGESSLEAALHMDVKIVENAGYNIIDRALNYIYQTKRTFTAY